MSAVYGMLTQAGSSENLDEKGDLVGEYQDAVFVRNSKGMNAGSTLFGLMSRLKSESAENTEFNWFERDPVLRALVIETADLVVPAAQNEADTIEIEVAAAGGDAWPYLAAGHILRNERTGEYIRVTADPTTKSTSVQRAINTADPAVLATYTLVLHDPLSIITLGKEEGALPTRASYEEPEVLTNYAQTFNATVDLTNAFKANRLRSDIQGPLRSRRVQALEKISKDIEMGYLLGTRARITGAGGGFVYLTGGVVDAVNRFAPAANALDGGGGAGCTLANFLAWLQSFMTVGSDAKLAFCGPTAYSVISTFANNADNGFRIMNQETVFGMNITEIVTPFGSLSLAFHPLLREIPAYTDWMIVVDLAHVIQKTQEPLFLEANIQTPGQDSYREQFRAKLGLKLRFADAFGYAKDLEKLT